MDSTLAQGHFELGKLYFQQAAYDRTEKSLEKAIQLDPRLLGGYYQYGLVCMRSGKPEKGKTLLNTFHQKRNSTHPKLPQSRTQARNVSAWRKIFHLVKLVSFPRKRESSLKVCLDSRSRGNDVRWPICVFTSKRLLRRSTHTARVVV